MTLPAYPYQRQRYWLDSFQEPAPAQLPGKCRLHPEPRWTRPRFADGRSKPSSICERLLFWRTTGSPARRCFR